MKVGIVVIGRNESQHLAQSLPLLIKQKAHLVYVDSGSTDGSIDLACSLGIEVVELDPPFSAARARNTGFFHLIKADPQIEFVQFIDGDCEIVSGWLEQAQQELNSYSDVAVVCGRLREKFPEQSLYNKLCEIEWNQPAGETKACGGIFIMRVAAFRQVKGFNPNLIAGEEPELCLRLLQKGWKILRINAEMAFHDSEMTQFSQWWKRTIRSGYAYAQGALLHGKSPEYYCLKEILRIWVWGFIFPLLVLILVIPTQGWSLILFIAYPLRTYRIYKNKKNEDFIDDKDAFMYAIFCVLGQFPQLLGQVKCFFNHLLGKKGSLIEYKNTAGSPN